HALVDERGEGGDLGGLVEVRRRGELEVVAGVLGEGLLDVLLVRLPPRTLGADGDEADRRQVAVAVPGGTGVGVGGSVAGAGAGVGVVAVAVAVAVAAGTQRERPDQDGRRDEDVSRPLQAHCVCSFAIYSTPRSV